MARVAIVIVTFNSAACIEDCLSSLPASADYEVIVVDNSSEDATGEVVKRHSRVRLIANTDNRGFAAAVNQGVKASAAPLVLVLNPDTRALVGIDSLVDLFSDPELGAAGGMLTHADGSPQTGFMYRSLPSATALVFEILGVNRLWPRNPVNWHYRCLGRDPMVACLVEQPAGALLMFTRAAWAELNGFDENFYPIWFEDVDFCARLKQHGYCIQYHPEARAIHDGAHSIRPLGLEKTERYWYGSLLEYAARHFGPLAFRIICLATISGAVLRGVRSVPRNGSRALAVYGAVCRLAFSRFVRPRRDSGRSPVCP